MVTPLAAAVNAMPIIALAPIFNNMFSTTSTVPRRLVVTIVVFFPVFINTFRGLTQIDADPRRADALLRRQRLGGPPQGAGARAPCPSSSPGSSWPPSLCVIAAIVAEYFGGLQDGLGSRITSAAAGTAYGRAWAYVAAPALLGLVFFLAATILERVAMPWQVQRRR